MGLEDGNTWKELPYRYPPYQTCHRQFQQWVNGGIIEKILHALAQYLKDRGSLDVKECFIDGNFASAKKGPWRWEDQTRKGHKDHGYHRLQRSSCRPIHGKYFAA